MKLQDDFCFGTSNWWFFEADGLEVILEDWEGSELQRMHYWKICKDYMAWTEFPGAGKLTWDFTIKYVQWWEAKQQELGWWERDGSGWSGIWEGVSLLPPQIIINYLHQISTVHQIIINYLH